MSKSRVLLYQNCPLHYKFRYDMEIPEPDNPYYKRGHDVHEILEHFFDEPIDTSVKNLEDYFETRIRKIAGTSYYVYQEFLDNFIAMEVNRCNELLACGLETHYPPIGREIKVKKNKMIGYIDRVDYNPNDGFILSDYKTAVPKNIKHYVFELTMYAHMFELETNIKVRKVGVYWLKECKGVFALKNRSRYIHEVTDDDIKKMLAIVEDTRQKIENEDFDRNPLANCYFCPSNYKKTCRSMYLYERSEADV